MHDLFEFCVEYSLYEDYLVLYWALWILLVGTWITVVEESRNLDFADSCCIGCCACNMRAHTHTHLVYKQTINFYLVYHQIYSISIYLAWLNSPLRGQRLHRPSYTYYTPARTRPLSCTPSQLFGGPPLFRQVRESQWLEQGRTACLRLKSFVTMATLWFFSSKSRPLADFGVIETMTSSMPHFLIPTSVFIPATPLSQWTPPGGSANTPISQLMILSLRSWTTPNSSATCRNMCAISILKITSNSTAL